MNESSQVTRRELLRWAGWFGFINAVLYTLIGLRYLAVFGMPAGVPATRPVRGSSLWASSDPRSDATGAGAPSVDR